MDLRPLFLLLSQKGIDNVNLEMLPFEKRKEIYESYGDIFKDQKGKETSYIALKAYLKSNSLEKFKQKIISEIDYGARNKNLKYCYYCAMLLDNNEMASYFEQFITECPDKDSDYNRFYFGLKEELDKIKNGTYNKV